MKCCTDVSRREFITASTLALSAGALSVVAARSDAECFQPWDPDKPQVVVGKKLIVQPLLRHEIETPKPRTSWRNWGGVHTEESVREECRRITGELEVLAKKADFPMEVLPLATARNDAEGIKIRDTSPSDVLLLYAAGANRLDPCITRKRHTIIFVRHRSGPVYDWYENASNRFLRVPGANFEYDVYRNFEGVTVDDVVVDDYDDILWRLRALYGLKNFLGTRAVTIGVASGKGCPKAPQVCREKFGMEIIEVPYAELGQRIRQCRAESGLMAEMEKSANRYMGQAGVTLETDRDFVRRAFVLYRIFKELLHLHQAQLFTIGACMSTVMPIAETTACLALSLMQDEGYIAYCESDFASHPAAVLLRHITGKPVFMHNPTFPHKGVLTCAHCTCPRRMDGKRYEPMRIQTHYESDYGAAPKIQMPHGQLVTLIDPDAAQVCWLGLKGSVEDNPFFPICRSQQDIRIIGDDKRLAREIRGSHWLMAYGDYLSEMGYSVRKLGLDWLNISETTARHT